MRPGARRWSGNGTRRPSRATMRRPWRRSRSHPRSGGTDRPGRQQSRGNAMITYGQGRRAATFGLALGALGLLGACTSTSSTETAAPDTVPPPQIVVVDTFAASPDEVKLDPGLSGKVDKLLGNSGSAVPKSEQETDVARKVASSLA